MCVCVCVRQSVSRPSGGIANVVKHNRHHHVRVKTLTGLPCLKMVSTNMVTMSLFQNRSLEPNVKCASCVSCQAYTDKEYARQCGTGTPSPARVHVPTLGQYVVRHEAQVASLSRRNLPRKSLSLVIIRSPSTDWMRTPGWLPAHGVNV